MTAKVPTRLPEHFGRYRILKLLGEGGMGSVYLARDLQLDRPVALKVPQFDSRAGSQVLDRFYQEARAAATIQHPNVCPVFDVGQFNGVHYLTMAFIEGKSLAEWVRSGKPLTPRQAAALVRKVALALHEAHQRGVVHRDLKPANIMINQRGEPVVMDFGLARRQQPGDLRLTQSGAVMGSPAYMAPEQVKGDLHAMGPGCDIYSLGVVLYELLTGRLPFAGDNMAVMAQILLDEPPAPSSIRPDLDPPLEAVCLKAMAKAIEDRHGSMAELASELQDYLRAATLAPAMPAVETLPPEPAKPTRQPDAGIHASDLGGGRSLAQAYQQMPAPRRGGPSGPRRRRRRRAGRGPWPWVVAGAAGAALLAGILFLALRGRAPAHVESKGEPAPPVVPAAVAPPGDAGGPSGLPPTPAVASVAAPRTPVGPEVEPKGKGVEPEKRKAEANVPITGPANPRFEPLDRVMLEFREKLNCTAAALAVTHNGTPAYSRGYGWADKDKKDPVAPDALFNLGLCYEPLAAAAVLQLARNGKLNLDAPVFKLLNVKPRGAVVDDRVEAITVRHVVEEKAGWQPNAFAEASKAVRELGSTPPPGPNAFLEFLMTQKLRDAPGTRHESNPASIHLLNRVVAKVTGRTVADYCRRELLRPFGIADLAGMLATNAAELKTYPHQVWNAGSGGPCCASAPALCEFMRHYWVTGQPKNLATPPPPVRWGWHTPAATAKLVQRGDRVEYVFLFNGGGTVSQDAIQAALDKVFDGLK